MDYELMDFDTKIVVKSEAKNRLDAKEKLDQYLDSIGTEAKNYYYLEVFEKGQVSGAICMGEVSFEPEYNRKFRDMKLKGEKCLSFTMTEEEYLRASRGESSTFIDVMSYIKENSYRLKEMPFFEILDNSNSKIIKFYYLIK